jgi:hypothetical protein
MRVNPIGPKLDLPRPVRLPRRKSVIAIHANAHPSVPRGTFWCKVFGRKGLSLDFVGPVFPFAVKSEGPAFGRAAVLIPAVFTTISFCSYL